MRIPLVSLSLLVATGCGGTGAAAPGHTVAPIEPGEGQTAAIAAAVASPHRSDENRARDRYRHPAETLDFFGVERNMLVIEMAPGEGWYTEILAPLLRERGRLVAAIPDPAVSPYGQRFVARVEQAPEVFAGVDRVIFQHPDQLELGLEGSADMVVTFRSTHGWINRGQAADVFAAMFRVLRPDGVLGLVQHRAADDADPTVSNPAGYVREADVIALAEAAGFVLEARSDVNRNPADDHDHPEGVWTLPPSLRLGETDREVYEQIGESDRMTLRFRKPANPPGAGNEH